MWPLVRVCVCAFVVEVARATVLLLSPHPELTISHDDNRESDEFPHPKWPRAACSAECFHGGRLRPREGRPVPTSSGDGRGQHISRRAHTQRHPLRGAGLHRGHPSLQDLPRQQRLESALRVQCARGAGQDLQDSAGPRDRPRPPARLACPMPRHSRGQQVRARHHSVSNWSTYNYTKRTPRGSLVTCGQFKDKALSRFVFKKTRIRTRKKNVTSYVYIPTRPCHPAVYGRKWLTSEHLASRDDPLPAAAGVAQAAEVVPVRVRVVVAAVAHVVVRTAAAAPQPPRAATP